MNISEQPLQQINTFFENYAAVLEQFDSKGMVSLYNIPCTLTSDETTTVFNDSAKLEGFFNTGAGFYKQLGIAKMRPDVWYKREWTGKIINVKVNWQFFSENNKPIYNCDYHYVIRLDKNSQWKIILSVSANERERMEEWRKKSRK